MTPIQQAILGNMAADSPFLGSAFDKTGLLKKAAQGGTGLQPGMHGGMSHSKPAMDMGSGAVPGDAMMPGMLPQGGRPAIDPMMAQMLMSVLAGKNPQGAPKGSVLQKFGLM